MQPHPGRGGLRAVVVLFELLRVESIILQRLCMVRQNHVLRGELVTRDAY